MTWEQRLREMILAGGALAMAACSSSSSGGAQPPKDGGGEGDATHDANVGPDGNDLPDGAPGCCNANPDPCCPEVYCGKPLTSACTPEKDCVASGGTWDYSSTGSGECSIDAGENEAGPEDGGPPDAVAKDAAPPDATPDADGHD
jgi:hypothetical protein